MHNVIAAENMTARPTIAGRKKATRKALGLLVAVAAAALFLTTAFPGRLSSAVGGSVALAELAARSPGMRVGGVALKAKEPRLAPTATGAPVGGTSAPGNPLASALGTSLGPEGPVPTSGPVASGTFPADFIAPAVPLTLAAATPGRPGAAPPGGFATGPLPSGGGFAIFPPGGGGGSGGSPPISQPPGGGTVIPPVVPPVGAVPEPATWLMLIAGFGIIGGAMRRRRRVHFA